MSLYLFRSERLGFRNWREKDLTSFSQMNADPVVMEHFPSLLSTTESSQMMDRLAEHQGEHGFTFFPVDELATKTFVGFIGLYNIQFEAKFTPGVEIGWRLKAEFWGKGYATEGARRCLSLAFDQFKLPQVYSFTALVNLRSEAVMKRIGMEKIGEFDHPKVEKGHRLERHVLYQIKASEKE